MATFYEIYQNYLQNPYGGVNALPGVNAISGTMGATPISFTGGGDGVGEVSSVSPVGSVVMLVMLVVLVMWILVQKVLLV
jgi:hypothetical protein